MSFFGKTDVQGIIFLAIGLFVSVSLASYYHLDPSLNSLSYEEIQNYCGYAGAFLSDFLYQGFGLGAWLIVLSIFKTSFQFFSGRKVKRRQWILIEGIFILTLCSMFSLIGGENKFFDDQVTAGGAVGSMITSAVQPLLHIVGTWIILIFSLIGVFVIQSHRPFRFYAKDIFRLISSYSKVLKKILIYSLKKGLGIFKIFKIFKRKPKTPAFPDVMFSTGGEEGAEYEEEIIRQPEPEQLDEQVEEEAEPHSTTQEDLYYHTDWEKPHHSLFPNIERVKTRISTTEIKAQTQKLIDKLSQFSVTGEMVGVKSGPAVTLFEFRPADSVKVGKITQLADDLSMALSAESIRIIAPIPGRDVVGIEASNFSRETVYFKDIIKDTYFRNKPWDLPLVMGRTVEGNISVQELCQMPHLMVAGTTGSGKSVFITSLLSGLLMHHTPETLRIILIDPKQVDLSSFDKIPHLLFPTVVETSKALDVLQWTISEMGKRYRSLNQFSVRGIKGFNHTVSKLSKEALNDHETVNINAEPGQDYYYKPLPYICLVVEEFGDLMSGPKKNQVEQSVVRLAQMARACGIHLILAMQSPRKDVVTGLIKTNIPGRISFKVSSKIDSRVILDESGAERLLAKGDMLFLSPSEAKVKRYHGPLITEEEIRLITEHWKDQGEPQYLTIEKQSNLAFGNALNSGDDETEKYLEIRSYILSLKSVSTSSLQRKFRLGYPRAARMIERFEEEGLVGPAQGSKPREVLQSK